MGVLDGVYAPAVDNVPPLSGHSGAYLWKVDARSGCAAGARRLTIDGPSYLAPVVFDQQGLRGGRLLRENRRLQTGWAEPLVPTSESMVRRLDAGRGCQVRVTRTGSYRPEVERVSSHPTGAIAFEILIEFQLVWMDHGCLAQC